jgi:hypothetical protein
MFGQGISSRLNYTTEGIHVTYGEVKLDSISDETLATMDPEFILAALYREGYQIDASAVFANLKDRDGPGRRAWIASVREQAKHVSTYQANQIVTYASKNNLSYEDAARRLRNG